jgi:hypothetical protein
MRGISILIIIFSFLISLSLQAQEKEKKETSKPASSPRSNTSKKSNKEMKSIDLKKSAIFLEEAPSEKEEMLEVPEMEIPEALPSPVNSEAEPVPGAEIYLEQNPEEEVKPELKHAKETKVKKKPE